MILDNAMLVSLITKAMAGCMLSAKAVLQRAPSDPSIEGVIASVLQKARDGEKSAIELKDRYGLE